MCIVFYIILKAFVCKSQLNLHILQIQTEKDTWVSRITNKSLSWKLDLRGLTSNLTLLVFLSLHHGQLQMQDHTVQ